MERRMRQRLVQAQRRLEMLQALLTSTSVREERNATQMVSGKQLQPLDNFLKAEVQEFRQLVNHLLQDLHCLLQQLMGAQPCASPRCVAVAEALWRGQFPQPWRPHAPAGPQPPWQWLRQLSRRGQLLLRYVGGSSEAPVRSFHLSAFSHPRRLLLSLHYETPTTAVLSVSHYMYSSEYSSNPNSDSNQQSFRPWALHSSPLHFQVPSFSDSAPSKSLKYSQLSPQPLHIPGG